MSFVSASTWSSVKATLTRTVTWLDEFIRSEVSIGEAAFRLAATLLTTLAQFEGIQPRIKEVVTANGIEHIWSQETSL